MQPGQTSLPRVTPSKNALPDGVMTQLSKTTPRCREVFHGTVMIGWMHPRLHGWAPFARVPLRPGKLLGPPTDHDTAVARIVRAVPDLTIFEPRPPRRGRR